MSVRTVRLAGEDLRDHHHVVALLEGPAETSDILIPFIVDGLEQGDRAFLIVDPEAREAHLDHLRAAGIDTSAALASRQLEIQTWNDAYLRGGRFDRNNQLTYVRESLREGRELGYPLTRLVASLDWAPPDDPSVTHEIAIYEASLDEALRTARDFVICTYDLNTHSSRTIAEVLGVHPVALVDGVLRTSRGPAPASARDRLLTAASQLFQATGIQATGVDALIDTAGVAKATFYRHFPSKDDLVVAWLRDPRTRWLDRVRAEAESPGDAPGEVITRFFDALADWLEDGDYRGCPYLNTAAEITDATHPAWSVIYEYLQEVEDYLRGLVAAAGYRDPQMLAAQLHALVAGSISLAVARRSGAMTPVAREAALSLLRGAERD